MALEILIPIAIKELKINILAEGDYYAGDLLKAVLDTDKTYWKSRTDQHSEIKDLYLQNSITIEGNNLNRQIIKSYEQFKII